MRAVLGLPAFRRLLGAYSLNALASEVAAVAVTVLVYQRTGSALAASGYFVAAQFAPALIAPFVVGRLGGRSVRAVLPVLFAGEALAFLALAVVTRHFTVAAALALALFDGVLGLTAIAVTRTATTDLLTAAGRLEDGNALLNNIYAVSFFAGPAIGGVVVASGGIRAALLSAAGGFVVMTGLVASARAIPGAMAGRVGVSVREGLRHARDAPSTRRLLLVWVLALIVFSIPTPVEIVFVRRALHAGSGVYGALLAVWGVGSIVGGVAYGRWLSHGGRALGAIGGAALTVGLALMAAAPDVALALVGAVVAGAGNGILPVVLRTEFAARLPDRLRGVLIGLFESAGQLSIGVGILIGGVVASIGSARLAFALAAGAAVGIVAMLWSVLAVPANPPA